MKQSIYVEIAKICVAVFIALTALVLTAGSNIDFENLANSNQNTLSGESINGRVFTASDVRNIKAILDTLKNGEKRDAINPNCENIIWFGNSQLHTINQYREGDHLAPYWLRSIWNDRICIAPVGLSLPNANLQEFLILSRYAVVRSEVKLLIIELCFDDLREDGLRDEFSFLLSPNMEQEIRRSSLSADAIVKRLLTATKDTSNENSKSSLSGTIQEPIEKMLNSSISNVWYLWASRSQIESTLLVGLYNLRNFIFRINPTTVRKMIRSRYDLNMDAFRDIIEDYQKRKIPILLYVAPIRQDKPIPYDEKEYAQWKNEVNEIAQRYGAYNVNLEKLVPDSMWGSYVDNDIDFMHFQGPGHRLVAEALVPHILKILRAQTN
jgi:hypothetical protein